MESDFVDRALIRLKRQYEKDEVLGALVKRLREKEVENGQLRSEVEYLQHELTTSENLTEVKKRSLVEIEKNKKLKKLRRQVSQMEKEINELKKRERLWIGKYAKLQLLKKENEDAGPVDGKF